MPREQLSGATSLLAGWVTARVWSQSVVLAPSGAREDHTPRALQSAAAAGSPPPFRPVSPSCRSDTPARAIAGGNGRRGRRSVTAVVTCHVKSSSVAWASLAPSSRSGQATSDASYRPRRTPSRLTCSTHARSCAHGRARQNGLDECCLRAEVGGEGHAPVVAVLLPSAKKADKSIAAPKGHGPPDPAAFPLQTGGFLGTTMGAKMATADPSGRHPLRG
jgi:hypothetical protein